MSCRLLILVVIALFFPAVCFAGAISNPASVGRTSLGFELSHQSNRFKPEADSLGGVQFSETTVTKNEIYLKGTLGNHKGNELFLKLGVADFRGNGMFDNGSDLKDAYKFSGAIGFKNSFEIAENVRAGFSFQYAYFSNYQEELAYTNNTATYIRERIKVRNPREMDLAFAVSYMGKGFAPYGGPVISLKRFSTDSTLRYPTMSMELSNNFKESNPLGGFFGIDFLVKGFKGNLEAQVIRRPTVSFALSYLF